ncbi:Presenilin-like signal peptide peptidase, partial [Operophtera brumata]
MADTAAEVPINIEESVIEAVKNGTERVPATIEGLAIAYLSLVIMAILPIFFGSFRSVKYLKEQKFFSKEYINMLLTGYFFFLGVLALSHLLSREDIINYKFTSYDHWIANNLFGIAFAINGVELLHLNNVVTGCILLCGLFLYDIFWVFGTNVMVTVAKSFEAPIK